MYIADDSDAVWNDEGDLYAFRLDEPRTSYYDLAPGRRPGLGPLRQGAEDDRHRQATRPGRELLAADFGMDAPPTTAPGTRPAVGRSTSGQWVVQQRATARTSSASCALEDIAYDKRPDMGNVVYIADSGRGRSRSSPSTRRSGRPTAASGRWCSIQNDPTIVDSLEILVEGDDNPVSTSTTPANAAELAYGEIRQPDNVETTANGSLLVRRTRARASSSRSHDAGPNRTTARHLACHPRRAAGHGRSPSSQSSTSPPTRGRPTSTARGERSAGERAGPRRLGVERDRRRVRRVSAPGAFLVNDPGAHAVGREGAGRRQRRAPASPDFTYKRSGGQLVLLRIPGA